MKMWEGLDELGTGFTGRCDYDDGVYTVTVFKGDVSLSESFRAGYEPRAGIDVFDNERSNELCDYLIRKATGEDVEALNYLLSPSEIEEIKTRRNEPYKEMKILSIPLEKDVIEAARLYDRESDSLRVRGLSVSLNETKDGLKIQSLNEVATFTQSDCDTWIAALKLAKDIV